MTALLPAGEKLVLLGAFNILKSGVSMKFNNFAIVSGSAALAVAAGFALVSGSASAGEWADRCAERLKADGRDTSGCYCLEERINADPSLVDEFTRLAEIADPAARYAAANASAKAAMDACTRK